MSESPSFEIVEGVVELAPSWPLHHGGRLQGARVGYRIEGPAGAPVVAAIGGISAHRVVAAGGQDAWWSTLVGAGRAIDTRRLRVLGMDYLGGSGASTSPVPGESFPSVSAFDQAQALAAVVRSLGIEPLRAIVGASYGGQVALAFAALEPRLVERLIVLSAAVRALPQATAWRSVQRQIVREAIARGDGTSGLKLARALAMATYRSPVEFAARFTGPAEFEQGRYHFPVERYLFARGDDYVRRYRPESFVALSESIDLFEIDPARVVVPTTLIAVCEDQLVPIAEMQALARHLGGPCRLTQISSMFGHDAFLKEGEILHPIVERALTEAI